MFKSFKEIAKKYKDYLSEAKMKKMKKWVPDEKGNLKKVVKKFCSDSDGKAEGYKVVDGKKCVKMSPSEIHNKKKGMKIAQKTKIKNQSKIKRRAEKIKTKKIQKGLIAQPNEVGK
jgi:hypothetical protein